MKSRPDYRIRFATSLLAGYIPPLLVLFFLLLSRIHVSATLAFTILITWPLVRTAYLRIIYRDQVKRLGTRPIPRVRGKWIGNVDILLRFMGNSKSYMRQSLEELFDEYNCTTLNTRILWQDQIISIDDAHIRCALSTKFESFEKGYMFSEKMESFLGNGIFNRDGDTWKMHRATLRPFFAKERTSDFDIFEVYVDKVLSIIKSRTTSHLAFDIQDLLLRFTMDTAGEFLFGANTQSLSLPLPEPGKAKLGPKGSLTDDDYGSFSQAFDQVQLIMSMRFRMGTIWPLVELFKDKAAEPVKTIMAWTRPMVQAAMARKHDGLSTGDSIRDTTLLGHLVVNNDDADEVQYQLLNMMMAARDSTASLMTFTCYFLSMHPEVTARLREEVLAVCGKDGKPTADNIRDMRYMRAVLNETLRVFPPVALGVRTVKSSPVTLPDPAGGVPLFMPGGATFMILSTALHRRKDLWGADSDEYKPERWLDPEQIAKVTSNPGMFIPFFEGPRICPGQQFATNQATYLLTRVLQKYEKFELTPEYQPEGSRPPEEWKQGPGRQPIENCWPAHAFTMFVRGGLWLRAVPASA